jgi:hemerythrin
MDYNFVWEDFYSVGNDSLDSQHRQILDIIHNLLRESEKGKDHTVLKPILDGLIQHILTHFQQEEQLLWNCEYPHFLQHKELHDHIRRWVNELREHVHLSIGSYLLRYLKDWWVVHIQGHDKKFTPYLPKVVASNQVEKISTD